MLVREKKSTGVRHVVQFPRSLALPQHAGSICCVSGGCNFRGVAPGEGELRADSGENAGLNRCARKRTRRAVCDRVAPYGETQLRPQQWGLGGLLLPRSPPVMGLKMSRKHDLRGFWNPSQPPKAVQSPKEKSGFERKRKHKRHDGFYRSREWLELRYLAFKHYGRRCMCCGAGPHECQLQVDHIKPRIRYPELALELTNLQILCRKCNSGKSWKDTTDWRDEPLTEEQAQHLRSI